MAITLSGDSPNLTNATLTTPTLTTPTLTSPTISGTPTGVGVLTSGTAVDSTSGTSIDFTGIPSWAKRVTVMFNNVSTSGTSFKQIQLILSGGTVVTTGYVSSSARFNITAISESAVTTGLLLNANTAADNSFGSYAITNVSGNTWVGFGGMTFSNGNVVGSGGITLAGLLTGVRITTVNGTDTFDAGSINILYE